MAEEKKLKVLITSILKPVNDTRMYGKLGTSLAKSGLYDVLLVGFPLASSNLPPELPTLKFSPLKRFKRISFGRLLAPLAVLKRIEKVRPHLLIITTHELLWAALLGKLLFRCKLIYDIQENYLLNILHTNAFPKFVRPFLAWYVRLKELIATPFIDHFFLAERGYESELHFLQKKEKTILENKALRIDERTREPRSQTTLKLLFSGTLAESTGVFTAIKIADALRSVDSRISLTIVGYAALESDRKRISSAIAERPYINLIGGDRLVPHSEIVECIHNSNFGIISYPFNPSTYSSMPTKLYEYLGYQLPILLIDHRPWIDICKKYNAAIVFDDKSIDPMEIIRDIEKASFYGRSTDDAFWENSEEEKLLKAISKLHLTPD